MFIFLLVYLLQPEVWATVNILDKGVVPLEKDSIGIQFFIDVANEERKGTCKLHTWTKRCCLTDSEKEDCKIMYVYCLDTELRPMAQDTLIFLYPTLFQHDQMGFCDFVLDQTCGKTKKHKREYVNIPFDTRITVGRNVPKIIRSYVSEKKREECSFMDEDSLNNCLPVNCNQKYSEFRPFYDSNLSKCVAATKCIGNPKKELPDIVLVPKSNVCRDLDHPLTTENLLEISKGLLVTTQEPKAERELKLELKSNCSTISQNICFIKDMIMGKFYPVLNLDTSEYTKCLKSAVMKIIACIVAVCIVLLSIIFCLNIIAWIHSKCRDGSLQSNWEEFKCKFKKSDKPKNCCRYKVSRVNTDVRNSLLRQVIVRDIPMELRESVVDICDRMDREVRWKKRYRKDDMGSQVSLGQGDTSDSSTTDDESRRLLRRSCK